MTGAADLLPLLARAVQQFHTYPPGSTMCLSAVEACEKSLRGATFDQVLFRVAPRELLVEDQPFGRGTVVEIELARRLHLASIADVSIRRDASAREIARFCEALLFCGSRSHDERTMLELLAERGVERIVLRPACRPEVLPIPVPAPATWQLAQRERARRDELLAGAGAVNHLYAPEKGWVRVDPGVRMETVSLAELALLARHPADLAHMLMRLTDGDDVAPVHEALARRFSDVAMLFAALDPPVARAMFSRLAQAVIDLEPELRQNLLRRTILPGLLDGRIDGAVLRDFPDLDLADSLCLLLDLETAAPEVVPAALSRLGLPAEREAAVLPLIDERLRAHGNRTTLDGHARRLLRVECSRPKSMVEFSAFDLALDADAVVQLATIRDGIAASDVTPVQLACLWHLVRLEANPEVVQRLLARAAALIEDLERDNRLQDSAAWIVAHRELADTLRETRPDIAQALGDAHAAFCTTTRAERLLARAAQGEAGMFDAVRMIDALGPAIALQILPLARNGQCSTVEAVLVGRAADVAPTLAGAVETATPPARRLIARVLGHAGPGQEMPLSRLLRADDEKTVRDAFRSLARIGTSRAASIVAAEVGGDIGWMSVAAEQTLLQFPRAEADRQIGKLLAARDFVLRQPTVAERLLDRAPRRNARTLLAPLEGLRFRFWNPPVARVGKKAHAMLAQQ